MATKKKAAKKKAAKKKAGKKKSIILPSFILRFDPRIKGDPPPPWLRKLDAVTQKQITLWVNAIINKVGR